MQNKPYNDWLATARRYDACLPDYFGGHHKPVLQVPVDGNTTRHELFIGLCDEVNSGAIDYEIEKNNLDALAIRRAILDCLYFDDSRKESDILFPDLELWTDDGNCEFCYAFFIVDWEESENE